ncbi:hypothetical protein H4R18_000025 [Coemansia javaensis]|uniref:Uncharacterized protein n=1 Tax=Coemansia javaensis TaxID=2761396 RepID=A0A9W8LNC6_9FUNG|nr:hypothetical protein H4R18_000025 [Coemansia javaensis]
METVPLSAQDALLSLYNHPLIHFFESKNAGAEFMPADALRASLDLALREFPILLGRICDTGGGAAAVVVDASSPNGPDYVESESPVHYSDIARAGFSWDAWPEGVATAGPVTTPVGGVVRLLSVHVVRLAARSGVVLFCNIPHYVLDGVGYYEFLRRWGQLLRDGGASAGAQQYTFSREAQARGMQSQWQRPLDALARRVLTTSSVGAWALARIPFAMRTRLVAALVAGDLGRAHFFRVSGAALQALASRAQTSGSRAASYSALAALFCTAVFCAQAAERQAGGGLAARAGAGLRRLALGPEEPRLLVNIIHTHRLGAPGAGRFVGNGIYIHPMHIAQAAPGADPVAGAAAQIAAAVDGVDGALLGAFHDTLGAHPRAHASYTAHMAAHPGAVTVVDERHYGVSGVDFGGGGPAWVSGLPQSMPNFVALFAAPAGGAYVAFIRV